jgi:hypothetical protein
MLEKYDWSPVSRAMTWTVCGSKPGFAKETV